MSRCSGFPEAFVHAALFCCPAHTVFGSPSPGHGKEDLCTVLPAGTNKAPGIHERQWLGRAFGSVCWVYHKLYLSVALGWWICCPNRCLWRFCEVCGPQVLFLWPALRCSYSRSEQLHSGYFEAGECHWQVSSKRKRKPN